jgi:hypothetical protein
MTWKMPEHTDGGKGQSKNGLVAFPIRYEGPDAYAKAFEGTGYGLVLDDDGETGYLYVTTEDFQEVYDALHVYNSDMPESPKPGNTLYIMWNEGLMRAGVFYNGGYVAIVDFQSARACCLSGFPEPVPGGWCTSPHTWDDELAEGMEFDKIEDEVG